MPISIVTANKIENPANLPIDQKLTTKSKITAVITNDCHCNPFIEALISN